MTTIHDISVLIATYNRSRNLSRTLEGMVSAQKGDLSIEFLVVDNGSTDQTRSIVDSFSDRLRIRYIFESRPGKNRALNTALEKAPLGKIVVFTDDDVDVPPDWFVSILSVCDRWPNHSVFGGRIDVIFPHKNIPKWASDPYISAFAFAAHNYSNIECVYSNGENPWGPLCWVRREVFDSGRRFNEWIGPRPTNRIMGSETSFLVALLKDGYEVVYSPTVSVGHRIQTGILKWSNICRRAYQLGRGSPHIYGLPHSTLLKQHPATWLLYRYFAITWNALNLLFAAAFSPNEKRLVNCVQWIRSIGYQTEAMRLAKYIQRGLSQGL